MQVRAEDEEVFEMNPIEYIRRDRWVVEAATNAPWQRMLRKECSLFRGASAQRGWLWPLKHAAGAQPLAVLAVLARFRFVADAYGARWLLGVSWSADIIYIGGVGICHPLSLLGFSALQ